LGDNFSIERIDAAYISKDEKKFKKFSKETIERNIWDVKTKKGKKK